MTMLHESPDPVVDPSARRFRAPTVEQALTDARAELGPDVEVLDASRIRRGGVGGFFATDLGVEVAIRKRSHDTHTTADDTFGTVADELERRVTNDRPPVAEGGGPQPLDERSSIERLLARASTSDGFGTGIEPPSELSFAEHLARELAVSNTARPLREISATDNSHTDDVTVTRRPAEPREPDVAPEPFLPPAALTGAELADTPPAGAIEHESSDPYGHLRGTGLDTRAIHEALVAVPVPTSLIDASRERPAAWPDPSDQITVGASALGRLVQEVGNAVAGMNDADARPARVTVTLGYADGSTMEFAADMNGPRRV